MFQPRIFMAALFFTNLARNIEIGANCYALDLDDRRIILDAGAHPRHDGPEGAPLLTEIADDSAEAIILSHAHQDHLGSLPLVMRRHPRALVFMSEPTRILADVMLHNSVNVMSRKTEDGTMAAPLFSHREVDTGTRRWRPAPLGRRFDLTGNRLRPDEQAEVSVEFFDAGHILGSVGTMIRAADRSVFYTGDVNFDDQTIMRGARFPEEEPLDVLVIETTRGDSPTPETFRRADEEQRFGLALQAALAKGGSVLVPLFALGKTQEVLAMMHGFRRQGLLTGEPIYIGGLSTKLTEIYDRLAKDVPRQKSELQILDAVAPYTLAGREGQNTAIRPGRIYGLSSGMMTEQTLSNVLARKMLSDPKQAIFFVGYSDPESAAGRIRAAAPGASVQLTAGGAPQRVACDVEQFSFSAHASREALRAYVNRVRPKTVVLVHGDRPAVAWFQGVLATDLPGTRIISPTPGETIEL